jgi:hypothetical protein
MKAVDPAFLSARKRKEVIHMLEDRKNLEAVLEDIRKTREYLRGPGGKRVASWIRKILKRGTANSLHLMFICHHDMTTVDEEIRDLPPSCLRTDFPRMVAAARTCPECGCPAMLAAAYVYVGPTAGNGRPEYWVIGTSFAGERMARPGRTGALEWGEVGNGFPKLKQLDELLGELESHLEEESRREVAWKGNPMFG